MGRLRNISESLKASAFSRSTNSESSPPAGPRPEESSVIPPSQFTNPASPTNLSAPLSPSAGAPPTSLHDHSRTMTRPQSGNYAPPVVDMGRDGQIEELVPVFSYLYSHSNKLYQEGYFLKLNDLDTNGKPFADRTWAESFAQLVGTVLMLWDAAALDYAGQDGEVPPTFINLADASIKMIQTLPTRNPNVQPLQNVLSISTAGKNRYLFHFNSLHSLTQWTAGIRLAMFEHASLHELYTGSLIAGKGKQLNNIRAIMERSKFRHEDWARVRFGAGTPWRRCWCVIEPPDEKEWQKQTKTFKKKSLYERPKYPKGDIKFYDTKKTKKTTPIATITDAYAAYAIYPQSKPLIDQSTLVKLEGKITIHSNPESKTEGFVFVMPELHPAVSGFEMMLRWLFPVWDTFHLYGRPSKLLADTLDPRGLMFAMPKERKYGYLDIIDVAGLIHSDDSDKWNEREWRKRLKEVTSRRMTMAAQNPIGQFPQQEASGASANTRRGIRYQGDESPTPARSHQHNQSTDAIFAATETPPQRVPKGVSQLNSHLYHTRSASESIALNSPSQSRSQGQQFVPSRVSMDQENVELYDSPPMLPVHRPAQPQEHFHQLDGASGSDDLLPASQQYTSEIRQDMRDPSPPAPVVAPPEMRHQAGDRPQRRPDVRPEIRREKSRLSTGTLSQMVDVQAIQDARTDQSQERRQYERSPDSRGVNDAPNDDRSTANQDVPKAMITGYHPSEALLGKRPENSRQSSNLSIPQSSTNRSTSANSVARKPVPAPTAPPPPVPIALARTRSTEHYSDSDYDRASSPDYASIPEDTKSEKSVPKPRPGVLKTVGDPTVTGESMRSKSQSDIPTVDFGITERLTPTHTPGQTPGHSRPGSAMALRTPTENPGRKSPFGSSPYGSRMPSGSLTPAEEKKLAFPDRPSPNSGHSRSSSQAWYPRMGGAQSPGPALSPEEFVQQRAAAARVPSGYVPHRTVSTSKIEVSPRKLQKRREPSRSDSRNSVSQDLSSRLTARELEHVAKVTGGPLINTVDRTRVPDPSVGLIGAIEAREQEKRNMKDGVSGQLVQAAIAQRQQHQQAMQMQAQAANERSYQVSPYSMYNETMQTYQQNYPQSQSQYGVQNLYQQQWQGRQQYMQPQYQEQQFPQPYQQGYQQTPMQGHNRGQSQQYPTQKQ